MINFGNEWVLRLKLLITTHKIQLHWTTNFKAKTKDLFKLLSLNPLLRNYFGDLKIIRKVAQDNKFMTHFVRAIIWKLSYIQTILEPNRLYLLPQQQKTSKSDKSEQPHLHCGRTPAGLQIKPDDIKGWM